MLIQESKSMILFSNPDILSMHSFGDQVAAIEKEIEGLKTAKNTLSGMGQASMQDE